MLKRFRNLRISLAAKCQILFGVAAILIIGAALYVPWRRMDGLIRDGDLHVAEGMAQQAKDFHVRLEAQGQGVAVNATTRPAKENAALEMPDYVPPRLIGVNPPKSKDVGRFELEALAEFSRHPDEYHWPMTYTRKGVQRYRLAMPLYVSDQPSCIVCHGDGKPVAGRLPAGALSTTLPGALPAIRKLLGIVVVDIPSQVSENELFLNRVFILLAGVIAGTLATGVFYVITTRLILQPVRVLQETAERVSEGDLNIRSDISTGDEFQQLSETFNTMLANLKSSDEQLRSINKALDIKLGQLAETNVALYESNRLKSEFLANVSHELRTPLNSILGFAELLREPISATSDAKVLRYLQNILTAGRNLLDLINDLLDLAKIEAGRMDVRSEPLSLGDVFEGLINLLKPLAEGRNVSIVPEVAVDVPIVHTDPAKLQQVLYNLLSNAIEFSPSGGRVDLTAELEGESQVRIWVKDQGPGIEPEKHEIIFEKFRQIDGSVTREHSGTGLGLAISRELTALLGGTVGVQSVLGQGAKFWVVLPLKTQAGQRDLRGEMGLKGVKV